MIYLIINRNDINLVKFTEVPVATCYEKRTLGLTVEVCVQELQSITK